MTRLKNFRNAKGLNLPGCIRACIWNNCAFKYSTFVSTRRLFVEVDYYYNTLTRQNMVHPYLLLYPVYVYYVEKIMSSDLRRSRVLISVLFLYTHVKCEIIPDINFGVSRMETYFPGKIVSIIFYYPRKTLRSRYKGANFAPSFYCITTLSPIQNHNMYKIVLLPCSGQCCQIQFF